MLIKNASASRIETFNTCLFKYWLTYHEKAKLKSNWGASHGNLLHDILEKFVNGSDKDWMDRLYKGYGGVLITEDKFGANITLESPLIWAKADDYKNVEPECDGCPFAKNDKCSISLQKLDELKGCPRKLFEKSVHILEDVFRRYNPIYDNESMLVGTEYKIEFIIPGTEVPLICILDLVVDRGNGVLEIIDYKFGNHTKDFDELSLDVQARICSYAARKEFVEDINKKGHKFTTVFLTFDYFMKAPATVAFTATQDAATEKSLVLTVGKIKNTTEVTRVCGSSDPSSHWKCRAMCDPEVCRQKWKGAFTINDS
jgi:hypothetical protein